ncbi:DUF962 domain-containing protein [Thiotrichales bacterium 19S3-7]|nr:DUF962 domain-containing protein [Thiotrichales bacterium 19S3-7]MCF6801915.1 DUF962 domain-containing protein [Thiotrichales bacterium 19S3-11]
MRSLEEWLALYAESHQNKINKRIHYICVPLIMFSILGILWAVTPYLAALLVLIGIVYYLRLSVPLAIVMLIISLVMLLIISLMNDRLIICLILFIISWIFQFIGHKYEGKKPSFFQDLQFLFIGPLWIVNELFFKKK